MDVTFSFFIKFCLINILELIKVKMLLFKKYLN